MALYGRSIWNDFTITLRQGNVVLWLIAINLGIFILQAFVGMIGFLFMADSAVFETFYQSYFYAPSSLDSLLFRPWTVLTYAFFHADFWHILFNLLYLYWFGRIFQVYHSEKRLLNLYLLGALVGSAFYIVSYNTFPVFEQAKHQAYLLGASGAVWSIIAAAMATNPAYRIRLFIIGSVPLWGIVLFMFGRDLLSFQSNPGGILAHFGGMITGFSFVWLYRRGYNIIGWMSWPRERIASWRLSRQSRRQYSARVQRQANFQSKGKNRRSSSHPSGQSEQEQLDMILDKISAKWYDTLSKEEKTFLFNQSNKK
ncbi:MAG: rhomboid family intramembrane serine protease [Bacteroidota bacterium]|nr:rhomboid family intramembrane serine protease [Bacteroidota bacterium]